MQSIRSNDSAMLMILVMLTSCIDQHSGTKDENSSKSSNTTQLSPSQNRTFPTGGEYTVGDKASVEKFHQLSDLDRALMIVAADNGNFHTRNPIEPVKLPYYRFKSGNRPIFSQSTALKLQG